MDYLTFHESKQHDQFLTEKCFLSFDQLIEQAGYLIHIWVHTFFKHKNVIAIIGKGNNGKDGLIACRYLSSKQHQISILITDPKIKLNKEFKQIQKIKTIKMLSKIPKIIDSNTIILDALFGTGINKPISNEDANLISTINNLKSPIISIDIPSGLRENKTSLAINATHTLSMMFPKKVFKNPNKRKLHCGKIFVLNFNFPTEYNNGYKMINTIDNYYELL